MGPTQEFHCKFWKQLSYLIQGKALRPKHTSTLVRIHGSLFEVMDEVKDTCSWLSEVGVSLWKLSSMKIVTRSITNKTFLTG